MAAFTEPKPVRKEGESAIDFDTRETKWRQRKQDAERDSSGGVKDEVAPNAGVTKDSSKMIYNKNTGKFETLVTKQVKDPVVPASDVTTPENDVAAKAREEAEKRKKKDKEQSYLSDESLGYYRS